MVRSFYCFTLSLFAVYSTQTLCAQTSFYDTDTVLFARIQTDPGLPPGCHKEIIFPDTGSFTMTVAQYQDMLEPKQVCDTLYRWIMIARSKDGVVTWLKRTQSGNEENTGIPGFTRLPRFRIVQEGDNVYYESVKYPEKRSLVYSLKINDTIAVHSQPAYFQRISPDSSPFMRYAIRQNDTVIKISGKKTNCYKFVFWQPAGFEANERVDEYVLEKRTFLPVMFRETYYTLTYNRDPKAARLKKMVTFDYILPQRLPAGRLASN